MFGKNKVYYGRKSDALLLSHGLFFFFFIGVDEGDRNGGVISGYIRCFDDCIYCFNHPYTLVWIYLARRGTSLQLNIGFEKLFIISLTLMLNVLSHIVLNMSITWILNRIQLIYYRGTIVAIIIYTNVKKRVSKSIHADSFTKSPTVLMHNTQRLDFLQPSF